MRLSQNSVCARQAANRITHGVMESAAELHQQQPIARAVTLACGETRDGSKNYEEWERKGII